MTNEEIKQKAEAMIKRSMTYDEVLIMPGLPLDIDTSKDTDRSPDTIGKCSRKPCSKPIKSTVLKDLVLEMTKDWDIRKRPMLLCGDCIVLFQHMIARNSIKENLHRN